MTYLKWWKGKTCNQEYSTWQGFHSDLMERSKVLQTRKNRIVQYHQTSFTRNVKETSLIKKEKTATRNIKIMKGKISLIKAIIQKR